MSKKKVVSKIKTVNKKVGKSKAEMPKDQEKYLLFTEKQFNDFTNKYASLCMDETLNHLTGSGCCLDADNIDLEDDYESNCQKLQTKFKQVWKSPARAKAAYLKMKAKTK